MTGFLARRGRTVLVWTAAVLFLAMIVATVVSHVPGLAITLLILTGLAAIAFLLVPAQNEVERTDDALELQGDPGLMVLGLAHLGLIASIYVLGVHDSATTAWIALLLFFAVPFLFYGPALWVGTGVTVNPDGILTRKQSGSVWIPWEALAGSQPPPDPDGTIVLGLQRPSRITRVGWPLDPERLPRHPVLAAAVRYYAANPGERATIGTTDGYDRMMAARDDVPRRERASRASRDITAGLVMIILSAVIYFWTRAAFDGHGLIEVLPPLTAIPALFGAALIAAAFGPQEWLSRARAILRRESR
jgi:hypothetical protein